MCASPVPQLSDGAQGTGFVLVLKWLLEGVGHCVLMSFKFQQSADRLKSTMGVWILRFAARDFYRGSSTEVSASVHVQSD